MFYYFAPRNGNLGGIYFFSPMICWIRLQGQPWYCTCSFLVTRPSLPQTVILWCDDMMSVLNIPTAGSVRLEQVDITRKTALGSKSLCRDWSVCTSVHQSGSLTVEFYEYTRTVVRIMARSIGIICIGCPKSLTYLATVYTKIGKISTKLTVLNQSSCHCKEELENVLLGPRLTRRVPYSNHSVSLSVCHSVCPSKNFNIGHNFFTLRDKSFIFGMCDPYDKMFPTVP